MVHEMVGFLMVAQALAAGPTTLALPGLNGVNLAAGESELRTELIAQKLGAHGVKVITNRDLGAVLGIDRQKQLIGCAEAGCSVELIAALGADGVMLGDLGRIGGEYTLTLKVLSTKDGQVLAMHAGRAATESGLDALMDSSVRAILDRLAEVLQRPELKVGAEPARPSASPLRVWALAPAALGVAAVVTGVVLQVLAGGLYSDLVSGSGSSLSQAVSLRDRGRGFETGGNASLVGGGVALVAAVLMYVIGASGSPPQAWLWPSELPFASVGVLR
jgi:hypothetical protein